MGFFDIFNKKKKSKSASTSSLETVISQNKVICYFTVEQQREWLATLNKTIPTIMIGGGPLCDDYYLTPSLLEEEGNMFKTVGRIALCVAKTLSITNIEKALQTQSAMNLIRTYCILDEYSKMLKEPYNDQINACKTHIYEVLSKIDLSKIDSLKRENLLFWAPATYDGDPMPLSAPDYEIHVFPGAAQMLANGTKIQTESALPAGYNFAQRSSGKILHLRTIVNPKINLEAIPLFTDPNLLLHIFTPNTRLSIVDYKTAQKLALRDKNICSGIIINPGRDNKIISINQLEQE